METRPDPRHPDHQKAYVQDYIRLYKVRKCEANALVVRPEAGRDLCLQAIQKYVDEDRMEDWKGATFEKRYELKAEIDRQLKDL